MTIRHLYPAVEPSLNLDFANSKKLDSRITFTRGSTATYTDESGIIRTAAANEARFDHDSDGNSLGLLIEESRTNLLANSANLNDFSTLDVITSAASTLLPDSSTGGTLVVADTTNAYHQCYSGSQTLTGPVTFSVFIKPNGLDKITINNEAVGLAWTSFHLSGSGSVLYTASNVTNSSIEAYPNSWYKISVTSSTTSTYRGQIVLQPNSYTTGAPATWTGDGTSGIYVWGAQLEQGSFPTSYIPTSGSTATRSADVASMTGTNFSSWYNQSEGTICANVTTFSDNIYNQTVFSAHGVGSEEVRVQFYNLNIGTYVYAGSSSAGTSIHTLGYSSAAPKSAFAYKSLDFAFANNNQLSTNTTGGLAATPTFTTANIGHYNNGQRLVGHISRLTYYPVRLPDATLQALTL